MDHEPFDDEIFENLWYYDALHEIFDYDQVQPLKQEVLRLKLMEWEEKQRSGTKDGSLEDDEKPPMKELEQGWECDVMLPEPRFPRPVRDLLNSGLLAQLIETHDPKYRNKEWTDDQSGLMLLAYCAMELGCKFPHGFLERLKSNYHRLNLWEGAQNQIRQACDEYVDGKPYSFLSLRLIRSKGESDPIGPKRLHYQPPGLESTPILEEHFLRFAPDTCANCGSTAGYKTPDLKRCAGCKTTLYCFEGCQKWHWIQHRFHCAGE